MDEVKSIQAARQRLREPIGNFRPPPLRPLDISPYLAMSLLQKAIRRGRTNSRSTQRRRSFNNHRSVYGEELLA
jgi:hypothetical protein